MKIVLFFLKWTFVSIVILLMGQLISIRGKSINDYVKDGIYHPLFKKHVYKHVNVGLNYTSLFLSNAKAKIKNNNWLRAYVLRDVDEMMTSKQKKLITIMRELDSQDGKPIEKP
jgi:hypothetical protein